MPLESSRSGEKANSSRTINSRFGRASMKTCTQVKGGRGKKASYKTVSVRCPEPIKSAVMQLIHNFHHDADLAAADEIEALRERIKCLESKNALLQKGYNKVSLEFSTFKAKVVSLSYLAVVNKFGADSFDPDQLENIGQKTIRFGGKKE